MSSNLTPHQDSYVKTFGFISVHAVQKIELCTATTLHTSWISVLRICNGLDIFEREKIIYTVMTEGVPDKHE